MTATQTITLNTWTPNNGKARRYVNGWLDLFGFEVERYKTGNIRFASLRDQSISNTKARSLMAVKVWLDDNDTVHVDYHRDTDLISTDDIKAAVLADLGITKEA